MTDLKSRTSDIYISLIYENSDGNPTEVQMSEIIRKINTSTNETENISIDLEDLIEAINFYHNGKFVDYETYLDSNHNDYYENTMNSDLNMNSPHLMTGIYHFQLSSVDLDSELTGGFNYLIIKYDSSLSKPSKVISNTTTNTYKEFYFSVYQSTTNFGSNETYNDFRQFLSENQDKIVDLNNLTKDIRLQWSIEDGEYEEELEVGNVYQFIIDDDEDLSEKTITIPTLSESTIQSSPSPPSFDDQYVLVCVIDDDETTTTSPGSS